MLAKKKKILIIGIVTIAMIIAAIVGLLLYNKDESDYVFEGTFVKSEISVPNDDVENGNADRTNNEDCFKRNTGERYFV